MESASFLFFNWSNWQAEQEVQLELGVHVDLSYAIARQTRRGSDHYRSWLVPQRGRPVQPGTGPNTLGWCQLTPLPFAPAVTFHQHEPPTDSWKNKQIWSHYFSHPNPSSSSVYHVAGLPYVKENNEERKKKKEGNGSRKLYLSHYIWVINTKCGFNKAWRPKHLDNTKYNFYVTLCYGTPVMMHTKTTSYSSVPRPPHGGPLEDVFEQ